MGKKRGAAALAALPAAERQRREEQRRRQQLARERQEQGLPYKSRRIRSYNSGSYHSDNYGDR